MQEQQQEQRRIHRTIAKLSALVVAMFVFAVWVMPPMYTLFCELTGLNGKTRGQYQAVDVEVDTSRTITVKFVAVNNDNMPWLFEPSTFSLSVHPGEAVNTHFIARNLTQNAMVGQAVPSMVPRNATDYFYKTECFCFNKQELAAGETAELGLQFIVDQDIPKAINAIVLSYSLFDVTELFAEKSAQQSHPRAVNDTLILTAQQQ